MLEPGDEYGGNYEDPDCGCIDSILNIRLHLSDRKRVINILQKHKLIKSEHKCERCGKDSLLDPIRLNWRCQRKFSVNKKKAVPCYTNVSAWRGGWLNNARIKVEDALQS